MAFYIYDIFYLYLIYVIWNPQAFIICLFNKTNLCTIIIKHTKTLSLLKV
jgi:hypothetical protein